MVAPRRGRPPRVNWEAKRPVIERLCRTSISVREMAKVFGVSHARMGEVLREMGLETAVSRARRATSPEDEALRVVALIGGLAK